MIFDFKTVPSIRFAAGCSAQLGDALTKLGANMPLIVSDAGIVKLGLLEPALSGVKHYCLCTDVVADPPEENVLNAVALAREQGCDSVVGFGGGSSMDVAKLVAVLLNSKQSLADIYGVDKVHGSRMPLIQIPTTAGTGSEATAVAIVTTGESTKAGVVSEQLFADAILLDPELTLGLPPHVTAATGIDAMVHAIEAYTSRRLKNPMSDMVAIKALSLIANSIAVAVNDGQNLSARADMLLGAMLAGQAFANAPVGAVHALAYPLGGIYHVPHGLSNSLVLPHVLKFNASAASELYDQLAKVILGATQAGQGAINLSSYFYELAGSLGLQTSLKQMDIPESALPELAEQSMLQERLLINNPRTVSYEQALDIYRQAF